MKTVSFKIGDSIDCNKRILKRAILEKILANESELVKTDSMSVLLDFEKVDFVDSQFWK